MNDTQTTSATSAVPHFTSADFKDQLEKAGDKPVFVDFYADWCGPCKMAAPVIEKLAGEYKDKAVVAELDVDEHGEIAQQYGVMSIPTVVVFKNSKEVDRKIGYPGEPFYRQMLDKAVGAKAA